MEQESNENKIPKHDMIQNIALCILCVIVLIIGIFLYRNVYTEINRLNKQLVTNANIYLMK